MWAHHNETAGSETEIMKNSEAKRTKNLKATLNVILVSRERVET